ncbi:MAG: coproporphyrinogen III oxidase, partial [Chloroflexi bacterium]|nr:coproporphyrinogen III oxidase [Chloroflexota bacterium]
MESFSIYIHIPFCRSRCNYCDFITYAGVEYRLNDYVEALCREITLVGDSADSVVPIHTIYFGGGTPSL